MDSHDIFISVVVGGIAVGLFCIPVAYRLIGSLVSPYPKANVNKRLFAAGIDAAICLACYAVFAPSSLPAAGLSGAAYILIRDGLFTGQSIGKIFVGLVIMQIENGEPCTVMKSIKRNLLFAIPGVNLVAVFLGLLAVYRDEQGMRLGDRFARTQVVEGEEAMDIIKMLQEQLFKALAQLRGIRPLRPDHVEDQAA